MTVAGKLMREGVERPSVFGELRRRDALAMEDRVAARARRHAQVEAVVLMHGDVQLPRDVASPAVVARDPVRVPRLHRGEQVDAERIAAVVRLAESLQLADGHVDGLN